LLSSGPAQKFHGGPAGPKKIPRPAGPPRLLTPGQLPGVNLSGPPPENPLQVSLPAEGFFEPLSKEDLS